MEFRDYLLQGEKIAGGRAELAAVLGQQPNAITDAKGGRRGLPVYSCIELAKLMNIDPMAVISASELVTEKNEKRKAIFLPFLEMGRLAHPMIAPLLSVLTVLALAAEKFGNTSQTFLL